MEVEQIKIHKLTINKKGRTNSTKARKDKLRKENGEDRGPTDGMGAAGKRQVHLEEWKVRDG